MLGDYLTGICHGHFMVFFFTDQIYKRKIMTYQAHINEIMTSCHLSETLQHLIEIQNILKEHFKKIIRWFQKERVYEFTLKCLQKGIIFPLMKAIRCRDF